MRILVVDDEYVSLVKLHLILLHYGDCDVVTHGEEASRMFLKAHKESKAYDLITLDIDMPGMKGYDVAGMIRQWESINRIKKDEKVKILIVTGMDDQLNIYHARDKGCDDCLFKPINKEKVKDALRKLRIISAPPCAGLGRPAAPGKEIILKYITISPVVVNHQRLQVMNIYILGIRQGPLLILLTQNSRKPKNASLPLCADYSYLPSQHFN